MLIFIRTSILCVSVEKYLCYNKHKYAIEHNRQEHFLDFAQHLDLLAILQMSLDQAILLDFFIRNFLLSGVRRPTSIFAFEGRLISTNWMYEHIF